MSLAAVCLNVQLATTFITRGTSRFGSFSFFVLALAFRASRQFIVTNIWKFRRALLISAAVFLVGFIPVVLVYLQTLRGGTWYRFDFVMEMIPGWRALLSMGDGNFVWSWFYKDRWRSATVDVGRVDGRHWPRSFARVDRAYGCDRSG